MTWKDDLRTASFRDVNFYVSSSRTQVGRRTQVHEYPGRDAPYVDDLGRATRRYSIEAFVLGDDYMVKRDLLRAAIDDPSAGQLVHPFLGELTVHIDGKVEIAESFSKGGFAQFSFTAVEAGSDPLLQTAVTDYAGALTEAADKVDAAASVALVGTWSVSGEISTVYGEALIMVTALATTLNSAIASAQSVIDDLEAVVSAAQEIADLTAAIIALPATLLSAVQSAYYSILGAIGSVSDAISTALDADTYASRLSLGTSALSAYNSYTSATRIDLVTRLILSMVDDVENAVDEITGTTTSREAREQNRQGWIASNKIAIVTAIARTIAEGSLDLTDAVRAAKLRSTLTDVIDGVVSNVTVTDDLYSNLLSLRVAIRAALGDAIENAPSTEVVTYTETLPSVVIAYDAYDDSLQEVDLITRNQALIPHPGFVQAGVDLIVAS